MNTHHSHIAVLVVVIIIAILGIFAFRAETIEAPVQEIPGTIITTSTSTTTVTGTSTATSTPTTVSSTSSTSVGGGVVMCTMDAKMCPDGTYVGRQGPSCQFAPCPGN